MKMFTRIALASILLITIGTILIVRDRRRVVSAIPSPQQPNDRRRQNLERLKINDFHGDEAAVRVRHLRRLSKGIARAMQDAEKKGLRKAFQHSRVILANEPEKPNQAARATVPRSVARGASYSYVHTQDTFTDGEHEITFIPYDDGDADTWEGVIYRYDPDWGDDIRYTVLNIQTEQPQVVQEFYYPPDGGDPRWVDPNGPPFIADSGIRSCKPAGTLMPVKTGGKELSAAPVCPAGWKRCLRLYDECCSPPPNLRPWFTCSSRGCMGVGAACSRTGPLFGECWGFGCTGAMLLCLV